MLQCMCEKLKKLAAIRGTPAAFGWRIRNGNDIGKGGNYELTAS